MSLTFQARKIAIVRNSMKNSLVYVAENSNKPFVGIIQPIVVYDLVKNIDYKAAPLSKRITLYFSKHVSDLVSTNSIHVCTKRSNNYLSF